LQKWAYHQRRWLKEFRMRAETAASRGEEQEEELVEQGGVGAGKEEEEERQEDTPGKSGYDEEDNEDTIDKEDAKEDAAAVAVPGDKKKEKGKPKRVALPKYFNAAMAEQLTALNCPWMSSACEKIPEFISKHNVKGMQAWSTTSNNFWYEYLELFRMFVQKNGNGFVTDAIKVDKRILRHWVLAQRKLHAANEAVDETEKNPIIEDNVRLLKSLGFIFDAELVKQHEERLASLAAEKSRKAKEQESSAALLEQAESKARQANQDFLDAKLVAEKAREKIIEVSFIQA
jgi:hypothetical protein